jgi:hypothetical protein
MAAKTNPREAAAAAHPDSWIAVEPGDSITGEVVDLTDAWSDVRNGGSFYPLLTISENGTEKKVHAFGAVLFNEIMRRKPVIGDTVTITYVGPSEKTPRPGYKPAERYRVQIVGQDPQRASEGVYGRIEASDGKGQPEDRSDIPSDDSDGDLPI